MGISVHMLRIAVSKQLTWCFELVFVVLFWFYATHSLSYQGYGLAISCHVNQCLPYTPSLPVPDVRGHYHLGTNNYHLGMTCNNGPNKVINDFNIFFRINITVNNYQSTHTFIVYVDPDHWTCTTTTKTTTRFQTWWGQFLAGSSTNKYAVVHSSHTLHSSQ